MTTSITRFEKWNYQAQYQIFSKLYIHTAKTEWIRGPAFIAFGTSLAVRSVLLTASVGDLTINGFRLTLNPYQSSEQRQRGWTLLQRVPWQFTWDLIGASLAMLIINSVRVAFDTEYYILSRAEHSKVDWIHAEAGTMDSQAYERESNDATGRAKTGREEWKNGQGVVAH